MEHVEEIKCGKNTTFKVTITGGHKPLPWIYKSFTKNKDIEVYEEDTVAMIKYYREKYIDRRTESYCSIWIFEDFLLSKKFMMEAMKLIHFSNEQKLSRGTAVIIDPIPTKKFAFKIMQRESPSIYLANDLDDAIE